jgi:tetratricopeptide (TPR) repeat protein
MCASRNTLIHSSAWFCILVFLLGCATPIRSKPQLSITAQAEALSHFSLGLLAQNSGDPAVALSHLKKAIQIDPEAETLYPMAVGLALELKQSKEAIQLAQLYRKRHPDSLRPRVVLGKTYSFIDRNDLAEDHFRAAAVDFPNNPESHLTLASFLTSNKNYPEAIAILEAAQEHHSENADLLHLLGTLYIERAREIENEFAFRDTVIHGIDFLSASLDIAPNSPDRWSQLGYAQLATQEPLLAQGSFEQAYMLAPEESSMGQRLLDSYIQTGFYQKALDLCDALPTNTGTDPEPWLQYLIESTPAKDVDLLRAYLEKTIINSPTPSTYLYTQLGIIYLEQEQYQEAENLLTNAKEDYPEEIRLRSISALLYIKQENYKEAFSIFRLIQNESPDEPWVSTPFFLINYTMAAHKSGHPAEAGELLSKAYDSHPDILIQYIQEILHDTSTSTQSTIEMLTRFHEKQPDTIEALYFLSIFQGELEEFDTALENARQFLNRADEQEQTRAMLDGNFYFQYAILHERTGQFEEAEQHFRKAIDLSEPSTAASAKNYIAYMWAERGEKLDMGLELILEALELEPNNGAYLDTLGWVYYMQERYSEALVELIKSSEVISTDPLILEHIGDTHLKLDDLPCAVKCWKKALELSPNEPRLIQRLKENPITPESSQDLTDTL